MVLSVLTHKNQINLLEGATVYLPKMPILNAFEEHLEIYEFRIIIAKSFYCIAYS